METQILEFTGDNLGRVEVAFTINIQHGSVDMAKDLKAYIGAAIANTIEGYDKYLLPRTQTPEEKK